MAKQLEYSTALFHADEGRVPSMIPRLIRRPLLVKDEEQSLAIRAKAGDHQARCKVIEANMRLVCSIAKQFHSGQIPYEDLVQEGAIGLTKAVDRFDADKGCRFSTYAVHWIKQSIRKAVANRSRVIRIPAHAAEERKHVLRCRGELEVDQSRTPTAEEIANACGYTKAKVATLLGVEHDCLSLDGPGGASDYAAVLPDTSCENPEAVAVEKMSLDTLRRFLTELPEKERCVIVRRLGLAPDSAPEDAQAIASDLGIRRSVVQQLEAHAIRSLRRMFETAEADQRKAQT
jgi:RNA polymerase sigma factor (sigma-70 family)